MANNFEDITQKLVKQVKSQAEGIGDFTNKSKQEIKDSLEKKDIKSVSLHMRNGERIDALMTPKQRKELDRLISRGRGGLVGVYNAVFDGKTGKQLAGKAEEVRVSASEVIAVGVKAVKDESDSFFSRLSEGQTARDKFNKMREAMHQPIGQASKEKAAGTKSATFRATAKPTQTEPAAKKPADKKPARKSSTGAAAGRPTTKKQPAKQSTGRRAKAKPKAKTASGRAQSTAASQKKTASKPVTKKPAARKPAAKKPTAKKPAAKKPAARKPAAKKPATRKPAVKGPAAKKPSSGPSR